VVFTKGLEFLNACPYIKLLAFTIKSQTMSYCAIFPKDEIIRKQELIEFWMANGFISSNEILDAEDVGHGVWNELRGRSFFQDIETDEFGEITSCC